MCGKIRNDRIRIVNIRDMVEVALIADKLRKNRLTWFRRICCRHVVVKRSNMIIGNDNTRGRVILKLILDAIVKND